MTRPTPPARRRAPARGFTLIELMISMSLAAMLMVALSESFLSFGQQLEELRAGEADLRVEEGLVQMIHDVRNAWIVEEVAADHLRITDALGRTTEYWLDANKDLRVRRPNGAAGVLVPALTDYSLTTKTVERLRPGTPADHPGTWFSKPNEPAIDQVVMVEQSLPVALGLIASNDAPAAADQVLGIDEQVLSAGLGSLTLRASFAAPVESSAGGSGGSSGSGESCSEPGCGDCGSGGGSKKSGSSGKGWGSSKGGKGGKGGCSKSGGGSSKKVDICHIPPGNPANAHTISVSSNAQSAHLAHGDTLGSCFSGGGSTPSYPSPLLSDVVVELYEARAPNNGLPHGPMLASVTLPVSSLPGGTFTWSTPTSANKATGCGGSGKSKFVVCHYPPGNPANMHTISVGSQNAVDAHLAHGCTLGSCQDASSSTSTPVLVYDVPTQDIAIDLSAMNHAIKPGRAHTLVVRVAGSGTLLLAADPVADPAYTGVAKVESITAGYEPIALSVARSLSGSIECTQTTTHDVISQVSLQTETSSGVVSSRSATVLGQVAIPNPWLGAVPGEVATLDLAGH